MMKINELERRKYLIGAGALAAGGIAATGVTVFRRISAESQSSDCGQSEDEKHPLEDNDSEPD